LRRPIRQRRHVLRLKHGLYKLAKRPGNAPGLLLFTVALINHAAMDIVLLNEGTTWKLQALTEKGADFLGLDRPGERDYPPAEAQKICQEAHAAGLAVGNL